jgi:hypothetical protein
VQLNAKLGCKFHPEGAYPEFGRYYDVDDPSEMTASKGSKLKRSSAIGQSGEP